MLNYKSNVLNKILILLLISFTTMLGIVGCANNESSTPSESDNNIEENDNTIRIGLSFDSYVIERWQRDRDIFVSTAKEAGADVIVQSADGDLNEQIEQIQYFIEKKVDAIVIIAVDCNGLTDIVKKAKDAGIYVIAYDRLILNADIDLYISFDNEEVGRLMAKEIIDTIPRNGKIICMLGSKSDNNVALVKSGFDEIISSSRDKVVYTDYCDNWEADYAYDSMQKILGTNLEFNAVMCGNDDLATMVYKALSERGKAKNICIVGQDADLSACQRIVNGWQNMTVYKSVENLAKEAANNTISLYKNGKIDVSSYLNNGTKEVPSILLSPVSVTKDNIDDVVIKDGFHTQDEVYKQN